MFCRGYHNLAWKGPIILDINKEEDRCKSEWMKTGDSRRSLEIGYQLRLRGVPIQLIVNGALLLKSIANGNIAVSRVRLQSWFGQPIQSRVPSWILGSIDNITEATSEVRNALDQASGYIVTDTESKESDLIL